MRIEWTLAQPLGPETCPQCERQLPTNSKEWEAERAARHAEWRSLTHAQKMTVLDSRIRQDMHQFELTPEEAHRVWSAGCSALLALRPTALASDID